MLLQITAAAVGIVDVAAVVIVDVEAADAGAISAVVPDADDGPVASVGMPACNSPIDDADIAVLF